MGRNGEGDNEDDNAAVTVMVMVLKTVRMMMKSVTAIYDNKAMMMSRYR